MELSMVDVVHSLAVDWLGWICYLLDKLETVLVSIVQIFPNL